MQNRFFFTDSLFSKQFLSVSSLYVPKGSEHRVADPVLELCRCRSRVFLLRSDPDQLHPDSKNLLFFINFRFRRSRWILRKWFLCAGVVSVCARKLFSRFIFFYGRIQIRNPGSLLGLLRAHRKVCLDRNWIIRENAL